jgi:photosystem II stability/assembly factor-like uncharacterized protein
MFSKKTIILVIISLSVLFFVSQPFSVFANKKSPKPDLPNAVQWQQIPSGTTESLSQVDFIDASHGWVVGFDAILNTDDGGLTWNLQISPDSTDTQGVSFISSNEGWMTGAHPTNGSHTAHTIDGGQNWDINLEGATSTLPGKLQFVDSSRGWRTVFRISLPPSIDIAESLDGGNTWEDLDTGLTRGMGFHLLPSGQGWVVGNGGEIATRDSFGQNFYSQVSNTGERLYDVFFLDNQHGWAVGENGIIIHTSNGGGLWQVQTSNTSENLNAVFFFDANFGWAVGDNGIIVHTENGGTNWVIQPSGVSETLYSLDFPERNNGWVVGYNGTLLHYHSWEVFLPLLIK